jgi:ATP-dependent DNA ligase
MDLPFEPPIPPMLAKRIDNVPEGDDWIYEPKWDGFRTIVFRDGPELLLQSRELRPLNRYFPELIDPLKRQLPARCVLDGEIVIVRDGALDFDALQLRLHPAPSRVKKLSEATPASVVVFDLLAKASRDLRNTAFFKRRAELETLMEKAAAPLHLTPATADLNIAKDWFRRFEGAGFDGVMAKPKNGIYEPDKRLMLKIKHERDCDCVVAGFRWYRQSGKKAIGSLLLGLYDRAGVLQHVGVCGSFQAKERLDLVEFLAPYRKNAVANHPWKAGAEAGDETVRLPGGQSRWSQGKDLSWEALRSELVAEVVYDHMQGNRFRHMAQFRRWRRDKSPEECTFEQLETVAPQELKAIFAQNR